MSISDGDVLTKNGLENKSWQIGAAAQTAGKPRALRVLRKEQNKFQKSNHFGVQTVIVREYGAMGYLGSFWYGYKMAEQRLLCSAI